MGVIMAKTKKTEVVEKVVKKKVVEVKSPFNDSVVTTTPVLDNTVNFNVAKSLPSLDD